MSILNQKTIKNKISIEGVGLHTGKLVKLKLIPSAPNTGITFKRTDIKNNNIIIPSYDNVVDTQQLVMTTERQLVLYDNIIVETNSQVSTIEHRRYL